MQARTPIPLAEDVPAPTSSPEPQALAPTVAPVVSILVISYNTKALTLDCLRSVQAETTVPFELIVLDNASSDGSAEAVAAAFPGVRLIAGRENLGFAKGNNVAGAEARGKYILLLNPDTVVLDHAIDRLVGFAERTPAAGIWGGRTLYADRSLNPTNCFGHLTLWSLFCRVSGLAIVFRDSAFFNPEHYGGWQRDSERAVDIVSGAFFLITRALWRRLGGFDLSFVMYGEEVDLCHRARAAGAAAPRMTPDATIVHYVGAASRRRSDKDILVLKARATLIRRQLPAWQRPPALFLLRMWPLSRRVGGRILARLTARPGPAVAAEHWGAVWEARAEWRDGFPTLPHPHTAAGAAG